MPTTQPRINVAMEPALHEAVARLARAEGVTLSTIARRLMREALELLEDRALARFASERERTFRREDALSHGDVWGAPTRKPRRKKRR